MGKPMTPAQWRKALKAGGVKLTEHPGWETHNRNHKGPWGDVKGVMLHHTAGRNSLGLCWTGTSDLPGPLCHAHISKTGVVTMLSSGRANHAGLGSRATYDAVLKEETFPSRPGKDEVDGNASFYGFEIENLGDGKDPYPQAQYDAVVRLVAAVCRHHGWNPASVIGHKEWTARKIDPSFSMSLFRMNVGAELKPDKPPVETPKPAPAPVPEPVTGDVYRGVVETDGIPSPRNLDEHVSNPYWTMETYLRFIAEELIRQRGK
jgi:N-acetylmuramoyl-L-alanine amidase